MSRVFSINFAFFFQAGAAVIFCHSNNLYFQQKIEFLLLFSIWKLDTFMNTENKANAHVCDRPVPAASFCYMVYCLNSSLPVCKRPFGA